MAKLNFNPRLKKGQGRLKPRQINDYPNRLDGVYISNFRRNQIVSLAPSKSNQNIGGELTKSSK